MKKIVTIHSFRQSVGKSSLAANLAFLLANQGKRIGLVDTDFQGASAHLFFGLKEENTRNTFNDFITGKCEIMRTVHDVSEILGGGVSCEAQNGGRIFLVPASTQVNDIMQMLRMHMDLERYHEGLATLEKKLDLDFLLVDTRAGLNENTMTSIALSNTLLLVLHPDSQDFQGTAVTVDVARKLNVPNINLVLNDSSPNLNAGEAIQQLKQTYQCSRGFVLSHADELAALGSSQPFALAYPLHPLTTRMREIASKL